jgi:hypothetical protein
MTGCEGLTIQAGLIMVRKLVRKQRMAIRKYLFVKGTIKNWNQLSAEELGTFPCKPKIFSK